MAQQVLSITQINEYIRSLVDEDSVLLSVAVRGELSNYKVYPSGHHYFTLKDESASLKCVMFRGNAAQLRFRPNNGMKMIAMGRIAVYPRDGTYQLYCNVLVPDGVGDLYTAFEQLKNKLSAEGLFDPAHKKPLPQYPNVIGIVTSSAGAAVHDMLKILNKRYPLCKVLLLPVRVQGAEAPDEIVSAIRYANLYKLADLLIVGRGGGSIEDLWAFNDEKVANAIYASSIPIISAVGHEPDVTISDFVADLRAATPSNAAEFAVPDQYALRQTLDSMSTAMEAAMLKQLRMFKQHLNMLAISPVMQSLDTMLRQRRDKLELIDTQIRSLKNQKVDSCLQRYLSAAAKLDALSPLKVLTRGYTVTRTEQGSVIRSVKQINTGDTIHVVFHDGIVAADVTDVKENV